MRRPRPLRPPHYIDRLLEGSWRRDAFQEMRDPSCDAEPGRGQRMAVEMLAQSIILTAPLSDAF